jgi:hypothetical protein
LPAVTRLRARRPAFGRLSALIGGLALCVVVAAAVAIFVFAQAPAPRPPVAQHPRQPAAAPPPSQSLHVAAGRPVIIGVFGDSLGDGVWWAFGQQLRADKTFQVVRYSRAATGLSNYQFVNVHDAAATQLGANSIDIAVVMLGANDEQGINDGGHVYAFGTPGWLSVYERRIDDLVALLRQHGAAVYWVGLPKMRAAGYDTRAQFLNSIFQARAQALGVTFVPTVPVTVDAHGDYDDHLPDGPGAPPKLMRAHDGIHMTMPGYVRLAGPALDVIRQDVRRALAAPVSQVVQAGVTTIAAAH